ncbi:endocuticle structural glycoprotein SgAbd-2-like [Sabethes cyaneus]|uniref:endocuticle structural glycoprotein SgAbd-2-like n=1 Tax=Sabethes cyaneus TaxID=53552 RepID=UPI00237EE155|nr:endocuticle structural glycoprotein SgAbd-2-like [Sabethes cyaneus]
MSSLHLALFVTLLAACFAAPQKSPSADAQAPIVSSNSDIQPDGSFQYSYETGNGIKAQNQGSLKSVQVTKADGSGTENGQAVVQSGSFSYQAPDGTQIELKYTADENGFHPEGNHLPVAPVA